MEDCWTIKPSPGRGLGIFAITEIRAGTVIMAEQYTIKCVRVNETNTIANVESYLDWALNNVHPIYRDRYLQLHQSTYQWLSLPLRIFKANSFAVDGSQSVVYIDMSRCNHSCSENARVVDTNDDEDEGAMLIAVRPIAKGEEITINYLAPLHDSTRYVRRSFLSAFDFICGCRTCSLTGDEALASDLRRGLIAGLEHRRQGLEPGKVEWSTSPYTPEGSAGSGYPKVACMSYTPLKMALTPEERVLYPWLEAKLLEAEGVKRDEMAVCYFEAALALLRQLDEERYRGMTILPTTDYVIEWIEAGLATWKEVRYPGHRDVQVHVKAWEELKKGNKHVVEAMRFVSDWRYNAAPEFVANRV
jgi:hypothetical protein